MKTVEDDNSKKKNRGREGERARECGHTEDTGNNS